MVWKYNDAILEKFPVIDGCGVAAEFGMLFETLERTAEQWHGVIVLILSLMRCYHFLLIIFGIYVWFWRKQQQQLLRIQSLSDNKWRQPASRKSFFSKDISATEDGAGDDAVSDSFALAGFLMLPALVGFSGTANASVLELNMAYGEMAEGLEFGVQLIYLGALLALLGVGSFLVVRQILIRRELESAAKDLQDRVRSGEASSEEFFELGAVMLRKKYYVLANKYLEQAIKKWDGDEADLAQVYNALGFSYFSDDKVEQAINQYEKALKLQPGYVTAWNNLGNVYEVKKDFKQALKAYEEALQFDPSNKIAQRQRDSMKERVTRFQGIPTKD